jgi:hypothetical protein
METSAQSYDNTAQARDFLKFLYGANPPGNLVLWALQDGRSLWLPANEQERIAQEAIRLSRAQDVYFGIGLHPAPLGVHERGKADGVTCIPGFWADIDVRGPAHKAENLPPTLQDAIELARAFDLPPAILTDSGHGLQAWWPFEEPWVFADDEDRKRAQQLSRQFYATLQEYAEERGLRIDNTSDLTRVLRLPGTVNHKLDPVPVRIIALEERFRHGLSAFEPFLDKHVDVPRNGHAGADAADAGHRIPEGQRDITLTSLAGSMRRRGMTESEMAAALLAVNSERCDPPLPEAQVRKIARSVARYEPGDPLLVSTPGDEPHPEAEVLRTVDELLKYARTHPATAVRRALEPKNLSALSQLAEQDSAKFEDTLLVLRENGVKAKEVESLRRAIKDHQKKRREKRRTSGAPDQDTRYRPTPQGLVWIKELQGGSVDVPLTNFVARIVADIALDDGVEVRRYFEIEAESGERTVVFSVAQDRFASMNWPTEHLGANAIVYAGLSIKDHARAAVQVLSTDIAQRREYAHLGWRNFGDKWGYLHAGGAIGPEGTLGGVEVALPDVLRRFDLPPPPQTHELISAVRASMRLLDLAPPEITVPIFASVWRAPLGAADFSLHLSGGTGWGKSELAALAQQHFGAEMDARHLPGGWSSTGNALEAQAFTTKDALFVIDDFAPTGSAVDIQRYHREADRVMRAQGNNAGRLRMRADASLKAAKWPRGTILSTGEDVPRGQSVRARQLVLELGPGDVRFNDLGACQRDAAAGLYARALVGFVGWVAPQYDTVRANFRRDVAALRDHAYRSGQHRRTPAIVADLALGLRYFLTFACDVGAIARSEAESLWASWWAALGEAASAQAGHQADSDPARRFLTLLSAAIASGEAHIATAGGGVPGKPEAWGWRPAHKDELAFDWRPQGKRVGWLAGNQLYLEPDASYGAAHAVGQRAGDALTVTPRTLRKRLKEHGWLASVDEKRGTLTIRRKLEGRQHDVLHLRAALLSGSTRPDKPDNSPAAAGSAPPLWTAEPECRVSGVAMSGHPAPSSGEPDNEEPRPDAKNGAIVGFVGSVGGGEGQGGDDARDGDNGRGPMSGSASGGPSESDIAPDENPTSDSGERERWVL